MRSRILLIVFCFYSACAALAGADEAWSRRPLLTSDTNCAVACAYLSARSLDAEVRLDAVIDAFPPRWRDRSVLVPAEEIISALQKLGFEATVKKTDPQQGLDGVKPGSILHLAIPNKRGDPLMHFVLYQGIRDQKIFLADPDRWGESVDVDGGELSKLWSGYFITVSEDKTLVRILWYALGGWGIVFLGWFFLASKTRRVKEIAAACASACLIVGLAGCGGHGKDKGKESVQVFDDLGVITSDRYIAEAKFVPYITKRSDPVKITQVEKACKCVLIEDNVEGSLFDPNVPREIKYRVRFDSFGPFHTMLRIKFDNGEVFERHVVAFKEGLALPSTKAINVPFVENSSSSVGEFTVERLRHHKTSKLESKASAIQHDWIRLKVKETTHVKSENSKVTMGDMDGVLDRLVFAWEALPAPRRPASQNVLLEWTDPTIPPVGVTALPEGRPGSWGIWAASVRSCRWCWAKRKTAS